MNRTNAGNLIRSVVPPLMSAAVITANIIWKVTIAMGDAPEWLKPVRPWAMPPSPASEKLPISPWPTSCPKTRLHAMSAQRTLTTPIAMKLFIMMASTFFERTMPP